VSEHWIRLLVKYKGKCSVCGKEILQGEYALWSRTAKAIKHVKCESALQDAPRVIELKCFICGKNAGCPSCSFEADCNRAVVSQACICNECMGTKNAYKNYQKAFLDKMPEREKMEKVKM
jgi:hypothetical protein